ncbi:gamma-glutamylaminecyclotransferase C [Danio rerio]|uniref:Gamma-glutamylaminecyclotransferase C n=1 Tax=Danio rerio TaxID=7955 RepID=GGACC_DANRE|nr:gamma-glutamylaminecyclotransferase C [Danio rerio]A3KNL6.1 RecName: Full=Gamma-glutamylaminecyclotransferase C; Short=GGACT C; AltName: Full=AIG2-like domain-containing protein 1-C; AltName: Full=Gamma-glutamylamine cyclotransferase C; AltName: Full=Gamma-glutamylamine cyclotransferase, tandem duplicate 3 [Danio rerio]AAI33907.1 Zgc:162208 protein [Danio rerio]|eukprot:NP_001083029.1 gamma-glutamylaminecyclotransferase C [Danio rerio]
MSTHHVFVYGSLKKGQPNHHELLNSNNGQAEFITCAQTKEPYPLVIATKHNIPFLLNVPGSGKQVSGEIYSVDQKMLEFLDWFEKCPDWYQRTSIQLEILKGNGESGRIEEASVYSKINFEPDWLNKPTHESYDTNGDHGLKFVCREDRKDD